MNLLWIDLETGGTDPTKHDILEYCFAETTRLGETVSIVSGKIKPTRPVEPEAARVNGYCPSKWESAGTILLARDKVGPAFSGHGKLRPAGWNVDFDLRFMRAQLGDFLPLHYHALDLMGMGWYALACLPSPHLENLADWLNVPPDMMLNQHTARGDVLIEIECYRRLIRRR